MTDLAVKRWQRAELERAFAAYQETGRVANETGDWNLWADLFTHDAVLNEHVYGIYCGREAIRGFIRKTMSTFPGSHMHTFPVIWHTIDDERGMVICEIDNPMPDLGDGTCYSETNITILRYAGNGLWCGEEDVYNPLKFFSMLQKWCHAAVQSNQLPREAESWRRTVTFNGT